MWFTRDFQLFITNKDLMIQVFNILPEAYDGTVEFLEKDLEEDSFN